MKRYILTGMPGCGKTSIIGALEAKKISVVAEAATDIIFDKQSQGVAEPWRHEKFIDDIVKLQSHRQIKRCDDHSDLQFYDRSPVCTYALSVFLGFKPSLDLMKEIERINKDAIYEKQVFFIDHLGFIENNSVRKITFEDALFFEKIHLESYKKFGYDIIHISRASIAERVRIIFDYIAAPL